MSQYAAGFYSNRSPEELWSRECFSSSFAVSLANHMRTSGRPANYIRTYPDGVCTIVDCDLGHVYGGCLPVGSLEFHFDDFPGIYSEMADNIPDMGLAVGYGGSPCVEVLDLKTTVVPDSSTHDAESEDMGPEITIRAPTLTHCALSMYRNLMGHESDVMDILGPVCGGIGDWSDAGQVCPHVDGMVDALNRVESQFSDVQSPLMIQAIWKTEGMSPVLSEDALDVFVWSDHSLSRLFLDSVRRNRNGCMTRPMRCSVRLARMLYLLCSGVKPDIAQVFRETSYGLGSAKEMMVNGRTSNLYMRCPRLTEPSVKSGEIPNIMPLGTESIIVPERRLDQTVYYTLLGNKT